MPKIVPVDFLLACSGMSLQDCELAQLNRAANLRKTVFKLLDELAEAEAEALLARWLLDASKAMPGAPRAAVQMFFRFETHPALLPVQGQPAKKVARRSRPKAECA